MAAVNHLPAVHILKVLNADTKVAVAVDRDHNLDLTLIDAEARRAPDHGTAHISLDPATITANILRKLEVADMVINASSRTTRRTLHPQRRRKDINLTVFASSF